MFYQILLSPQVKRSRIISNKYGICELPHELPNDLLIYQFYEIHEILAFVFHEILALCAYKELESSEKPKEIPKYSLQMTDF